ncbi:hypothetical protein PR002_g33066 [Phytophthora rubi]|uniref:Uncharacterized protein n=1 Tax=Phytophthora rubi TaxID=129364 RepID=A0A6A3G347_9STRA|nr:hypothetical protein PR002_g33066 [Phytophthora rubi]
MDVIADRKAGGKIRGQILPNGHPTTDIATAIILRGRSWSTSCRSGLSDHQPLSCNDGKSCASVTLKGSLPDCSFSVTSGERSVSSTLLFALRGRYFLEIVGGIASHKAPMQSAIVSVPVLE